jgi:PilZ domain
MVKEILAKRERCSKRRNLYVRKARCGTNTRRKWQAEMQNRRSAQRHKSFLQGRIYFNNRRSSIDCVVRDFSETGARVSDAIIVPDAVELYIPAKDETYRAKVLWRRNEEMGVTFSLHETFLHKPADGVPDDLSERVEKLEREVAKLRRIVGELRSDTRQNQLDD